MGNETFAGVIDLAERRKKVEKDQKKQKNLMKTRNELQILLGIIDEILTLNDSQIAGDEKPQELIAALKKELAMYFSTRVIDRSFILEIRNEVQVLVNELSCSAT